VIVNGGSKTTADPLGSTPLYFAGAFIKLIGVLLLIVISAVLLRRWLQIGPNARTGHQLRLLETVRLSPKQALHLIAIGDQQLLIGATDQNVSLLSPVEGGFSPIAEETTNHQQGLDFGSLLQSFTVHQPAESKGLKTTNEE
jgi:flagellar protein FliO/FliZ